MYNGHFVALGHTLHSDQNLFINGQLIYHEWEYCYGHSTHKKSNGRCQGKISKDNGNKATEYEKPDYLNKRCLACNENYKKRSKYQI